MKALTALGDLDIHEVVFPPDSPNLLFKVPSLQAVVVTAVDSPINATQVAY